MSNKKKRKQELKLLRNLKETLESRREIKPIYFHGVMTDYSISNLGEVYSYKNNKLKELKPVRLPNGYYVVTLYIDKKAYRLYIHRLVGFVFLPIPEIYQGKEKSELEINHKNGTEKWNNTIFNIEWVDSSDNKKHAYKTGLQKKGEANVHAIYTDKQIMAVCEFLQDNKLTPKEIKELTGVSISVIHDIKNKGSWTHISDKYDFSNYTPKQQKYSCESINLMKTLLKENKKSCREISEITGIDIKNIYYYRSKYFK